MRQHERNKERKSALAAAKGKKSLEDLRFEWDFGRVPDSELEACFLYEWGREIARKLPDFEKAVDLWREINQSILHPVSNMLLDNALWRYTGCNIGISLRYFPEIPWQSLDENLRDARVADLRGQSHRFIMWTKHEPYDSLDIRSLETRDGLSFQSFEESHRRTYRRDQSQTEYGVFAVDWNYPDACIIESFERWISESRGARERTGEPNARYYPPAHGGYEDKLRLLSAMRLKDSFAEKELFDTDRAHCCSSGSPRRRNTAIPYSSMSDLYKNAKKGREFLEQLLSARGCR